MTDNGGGLYTLAHVVLNISDTIFEDNYAGNEGGGLYVYTRGGVLQRLTVRNNRAAQHGGGAEVTTAANGSCGGICPVTTWKDSVFENNEAPVGGGIHSHYRTVHDFENVEFRNNHSTVWAGGGFYLTGELTTVNMTDCSFVGNTSVSVGGGMYIFHMADVKLVKTDFTSNRAMSSGAGLEVFSDSTVHVINSRFLGNELDIGSSSTRNGGALNVGSSDVFVVNSVFAGNQAIQGAAAATGTDGYLQLVNCTIGYNVASRAGGGINVGQGTVDVRNSILWGNASDPQYEEQIHVFQGAAAVELNVVQDGWPGNNNMDVDPLFVDFAGPDGAPGTIDDDFRLRFNSQAMNVGDAAFLPLDIADLDNDADTSEGIPLDLAGQPRILGAALDLGAYERLLACQAGFFSATGQEPCSACPAGEHQPNVQATNCLPCSPGTFSAATASANCSPCSSGSFQPNEGQTSCAACSCNDGQSCTLDSCDAVFGECQHQLVCSVPAVSAWGALILVLLIGVAATLVLGSRRYESETI